MAALADLLEAEGGESAVVFRQLDARLQLQGLEASCPRTRLSQREHAPSEAPALQARPHRDLAEVEGVAARRGEETAGKRAVDVGEHQLLFHRLNRQLRRIEPMQRRERIDATLHRSEERRVGKEGGRTCRSRWSP